MDNQKINIGRIRDAISIRRNWQICYREIKYKEGDVKRKCHLNFEKIDDRCYHCKWYMTKTERSLICTGKDIEGLINYIHQFAPTMLDHHKNIVSVGKELQDKSSQKILEAEKIEGE